MERTKYRLEITEADEKWDDFVEKSPNGTIFSKSYFLKASNETYTLFYCYKNEELRAAVTIIDIKKRNFFTIYHGIMYNIPSNKQNNAQQLSEQFDIQSFIAKELTQIYTQLDINLHPSIIDIRSFLWVNYNENKPKYNAQIQYTSYIDISDFDRNIPLENITLYKNASNSRRQQIRYSMKKGYTTLALNDIDSFINLYQKTMERQSIDTSNTILKDMRNIISTLLKNNVAKIYASYDELNELCSMILIGWDTKRAYYIFGANNPIKRNSHGGTAVLWNTFYELKKQGITQVDLEGVNSPLRGWFKLSFGGTLLPYYRITFNT